MDNKQAFVNPGGGWINRLQRKWGVESVGQVLLIVLVFSLAGSTAVLLRKAFFGFVGIDTHTAFPIKTIVYLAFLFPTYQCLLLVYGALLGQFRFFWNKERKMLLTMRRVFVKA
jgi:hypothetical protein